MATTSMHVLTWFRKHVEAAEPDLLGEMPATFANSVVNRSRYRLWR